MGSALSSGVSGLQAHQKMLDVAGNNLANVNTTAFKSSRIIFSELLSETIKKASQPTANTGGTNPQQMGSGVGVAGIIPNMVQGNIVSTGNPLDMAIEGEGYFVVNDGSQNIYTRAGSFAVDQDYTLVDPATGYRVQRIGATGSEFQLSTDGSVHVPYDVQMQAKETGLISVGGNLSADAAPSAPSTNVITATSAFTTNDGDPVMETTLISDLDQYSDSGGSGMVGSTMTITGTDHSGTAISSSIGIDETDTLGDLITSINTVLGSAATATLANGKIRITDSASGYSMTDVNMTFGAGTGTAALDLPDYFEITTVGGTEVKDASITIYDSQGGSHVLSAAFVRTDTANTWDMVITSVSGTTTSGVATLNDRRIQGIEFNAVDGSFSGLNTATGDSSQFEITWTFDTANTQSIDMSMGTVGGYDGLTQFAGNSTAVAREQDGYQAGSLSTVSVNNEGILIGAFSNGIKNEIAALQIALFQNPTGLENVGNGYFLASANSGEAMATRAMSAGAGSVHGASLEKSNADVATEFINLIQAQNGFQANARTIRVANDILRELSNLIR